MHGGSFEPATQKEEKDEREKLHEQAEAREKKYGIRFREGKGHLTPPKDYPQNEEDYADPVNYAYPLVPEDRCRNALARWSQFREEYDQSERNIIYERIVEHALQYGISVRYNSELPEAKALPENIKKQLESYDDACMHRCYFPEDALKEILPEALFVRSSFLRGKKQKERTVFLTKLGVIKHPRCICMHASKQEYAKAIAKADFTKLAHLIKACGFLMQTKVYLFWKSS